MDQAVVELNTRVAHLIKTCTISNTINTTGTINTAQLTGFQGQEIHNDRPIFGTWGMTSVAPVHSQAITLGAYGLNNNRVVIGTHDVNTHPKNLQTGETQLYDSKVQSIYLKNGTNVEITANNIVNINVDGTNIVSVKSGSVYVNGNLIPSNGATGSFSTPTGQTVTVTAGIITSID